MAPEIIDMSGGGTTSDIWSLGCTVIELLTGFPPYYELSTMQALFNIVEDNHPPIPKGISRELEHFLLSCCFLKDPVKRPTAKALLEHPWILTVKEAPILDYERAVAKIYEFNRKFRDSERSRALFTEVLKYNDSGRNSLDGAISSDYEEDFQDPGDRHVSPRRSARGVPSPPLPNARPGSHKRTKTNFSKRTRNSNYLNMPMNIDYTDMIAPRKGMSVEQLQAELAEVIRERDVLREENQELRSEIEKVIRERDALKEAHPDR